MIPSAEFIAAVAEKTGAGKPNMFVEIGTVVAVDIEDNGMTMYAEIQPTVSVNDLTQVFVVLGYETATDVVDATLNLSRARLERVRTAYEFDTALARLLNVAGMYNTFLQYLHAPSAQSVF